MFLEKYLDEFYFKQVLLNYEEGYLRSLDEENFLQIYHLFLKYNFYFVNDIILNYLEIFEMDKTFVLEKLLFLKGKLGDKFNYIIGQDMRYLNYILELA